MLDLSAKKCVPCEGGTPVLSENEARKLLRHTPGWELAMTQTPARIFKKFAFKNFREVMAFLNKVANIAEEQGHHPDIEAHYSSAILTFTTHAIKGLSENDFIMAARINAL